MRNKIIWQTMAAIALGAIFLVSIMVHAENIDPNNDDSQYAYGENAGWLNAEPLGDSGPGIEVEDSRLTGYMWGENIGWVSLSCENRSSCSTVDYGVTNDGNGNLSGYAWSENAGWISFSCDNTGNCATVDYGVTIDPITGEFSGKAWGENIGWISFNSTGAVAFGITAAWTPPTGDLNVDIVPQGAIDGGAKWKLTSGPDTSWKESGDTITDLPVGVYTIRFKNTYGWVKPANQVLNIIGGITNSATGTYTQITTVGSVSATIEPQGAIDDGAKWKLTSGPDTSWKDSGDVISSLAVGTYTVSFKNTYGWVKPANQSIEVTDGMTATTTAIYTQITAVGSASATIEPQGAIDEGAKWKLTSGPDTSWKDSGDVISGLAVGTYTVSFKYTYGWVKPANQSI
ncbi:MAG: hypothetical protein GY941_12250, partial [Planctomycetes bacterium]|nr:hypothetical protein [Planctomycetota bacterium]